MNEDEAIGLAIRERVVASEPYVRVDTGDLRATAHTRMRARRWAAVAGTVALDHVLDVVLIYETPMTVEGLESDCAAWLAMERADVCAHDATTTGALSQYIERAAYPAAESWPTPNDDLLVSPVPASDQWYLHQVKVFNPNGLTVVATEVVHTASSASAAQEWTLTRSALARLASAPTLTFPHPRTAAGR